MSRQSSATPHATDPPTHTLGRDASPKSKKPPGRFRRWLLRLFLIGLVLLLGLVAAAWFGRDSLLLWAQNQAVDRLERDGIHLSLGAPRWVSGGGIELSELRLHPDSTKSTDLLRLGQVRVQPDYGLLISERSLDVVLTSQDESLWVVGMEPDDRVGLDDVELLHSSGGLELVRGHLGVGDVVVRASGRIPTGQPKPDDDSTETPAQRERAAEDRASDLVDVFEQVGDVLAKLLVWTRLHSADDAAAPSLTLILDQPSGGVSGRLEGEDFEWQGLTWDHVLLAIEWDQGIAEVSELRLEVADSEIVLRGRHRIDQQVLEIDHWQVSGNPLGPLLAYTGDEDQAAGWEVVRPVVIEGTDLRLPFNHLEQVSGQLTVREAGELRWTPPGGDAGEERSVLTLNDWRLEASLADGTLKVSQLGLGGEVAVGAEERMPLRLNAVGEWSMTDKLVTVPQWTVEGDLLGLTTALLPALAKPLAPFSLEEPLKLAGSGWSLPLQDIGAAAGSVSSDGPLVMRWRPGRGQDGEAVEDGLLLTVPELRLGLSEGRLEVVDLTGRIDVEDSGADLNLSAALPLGGGELEVDQLELIGDLPKLVGAAVPRAAAAMKKLRWSGDGAGLRARNARIPFKDLKQISAELATTAPVDFVWQLADDKKLSFSALELEGAWADQGLKVDRLVGGWLGGALAGEAAMSLAGGFNGIAGQLSWTDQYGALEVPFDWAAKDRSLTLGGDTRSQADLLALWSATPWGADSLPDRLEFGKPPGLALQQPMIIRFAAASEMEVALRVTDAGTILIPTTDDQQLEVGIQQLHAQRKAGIWSLDEIDAIMAEGKLTGTARSRADGLWDINATWTNGDVSLLLGNFGLDRAETQGSRATVTYTGVVGGSLAVVKGGGKLEMKEAPLVNVFILREIYQLIAILLPIFQSPGVGTVTADYHINQGVLFLEDVVARSATVVVRSSGDVDFNEKQLELQATVNLQGIVGLATAIASRALEVEVAGSFDDFKVRLRNAGAFAGVPGFVLDSSKVVVQSGYRAPIKVLEIGADGSMKVLGEGARIIEGGVRGLGGALGRLPFLGRDREEEARVPVEQEAADPPP